MLQVLCIVLKNMLSIIKKQYKGHLSDGGEGKPKAESLLEEVLPTCGKFFYSQCKIVSYRNSFPNLCAKLCCDQSNVVTVR